ncbi:hypothetical protein LSH36_411g02016 [Paralvinella palmiformis]|uniref:Uncharacterized protein n=1 Tax=Paralvinella palmiformis TaxID=53620 RepID=A0AAD9JC33_9ANNE|nr:hypothetical protein LSH36_411g02016 [Paralvinella palmiformis]
MIRRKNSILLSAVVVTSDPSNPTRCKISYCVPRDSLRNICAQIRVETPLYTLVREPAIPSKCPFKDAFYFDYNDQSSGFCDTPISYAKPCAGHTKYQLHFKHCKQYVMFHNSVFIFRILIPQLIRPTTERISTACRQEPVESGTGQLLRGPRPGILLLDRMVVVCWSRTGTRDEPSDLSFRGHRVKYQHYGTEMYMAMSVDATCQGLRSPHDGPITMQFSKDIFGWPPPSCNYPDWLSDVTWRDIDGRHTYSFVADSRVMSGYYRKRMNTNPEVQSEHRCVEVMEDSKTGRERTAIVYSFTTHKCMSKHQCLKFKMDAEGKVQFYQGVMGEYESGKVCLGDSEYNESQMLMEENPSAIECPLKGSYLLQNGEGCHQRISVGCLNKTLLTFSATCDDVQGFVWYTSRHKIHKLALSKNDGEVPSFREDDYIKFGIQLVMPSMDPAESPPDNLMSRIRGCAQSIVTLQCILTWEDSGRIYLLAKEPGADSRLVNCFSFKERHNTVHYTTDRKCGSVASGQLDKSVKYELLEKGEWILDHLNLVYVIW